MVAEVMWKKKKLLVRLLSKRQMLDDLSGC